MTAVSSRLHRLVVGAALAGSGWIWSVAAEAPAPAGESPPGPAAEVPAAAPAPAAPETQPAPPAGPSPETQALLAAIEAAQRANENLAARLGQMETALALQRERDQLFLRDVTQTALTLAAGLAGIGVLALVAVVFLQMRAARQQALALSNQLQLLTTFAPSLPPPAPNPALAAAQTRFQSTADKLERRLDELESLAAGRPGSGPAVPPPVVTEPGTEPGEQAVDLIARAHDQLQQGHYDVALAYLDQALLANPLNAQAHLKKGAVLERMGRLKEALTAYDGAVAADRSLAVAHLARAGVLNKLQRFSEALKCYEAALAVQQGGAEQAPAA